MDESPEQAVPPTFGEVEAEETKWPKVIGIISLIYALGGLLCQGGVAVSTALGDAIARFFGADITTPVVLKAIGIMVALTTFAAGVVMLAGAIKLLRRRRSGPSLLRKWVVMRIALVLIGVVVMVLTGPAQTQMQRSMLDFQNDLARERGQMDRIQERTDDELWHTAMLQGGIFAGLFAIYPVFLGLWLSRKKIAAEVEQWG